MTSSDAEKGRHRWIDTNGVERADECFDGDSWGRHAFIPEGDETLPGYMLPSVCLHCGKEIPAAVNLDEPVRGEREGA